MAPIDNLNDVQRAVLQLLLRQGRSYANLAGPLKDDEAGVRRRARGAVAALSPDAGAIGDERRDEIADYLLGQQTASRRAATREYLEGSSAGRAWARAAAAALEPIGGDTLPDVPAERQEVAEAFDALDRRTARQEEVKRSSQLGTRLIYAGVGVAVAIVIILVVTLSGGDDPQSAATTTPTATTPGNAGTTPTGDKYDVVAQGTLLAPKGGDAKAKGEVAIFKFPASNQYRFGLTAEGLRQTRKGEAYGVWLYSSNDKKRFLGFPDTQVGKDGKLQTVTDLSPDTPTYAAVLLTRERSGKPTKPGTLVLAAQMLTADAARQQQQQQQQTQTQTTTTP
jgi:hypothetical protein